VGTGMLFKVAGRFLLKEMYIYKAKEFLAYLSHPGWIGTGRTDFLVFYPHYRAPPIVTNLSFTPLKV
jgi:hypothetical protein